MGLLFVVVLGLLVAVASHGGVPALARCEGTALVAVHGLGSRGARA